MVEIRLLNDKNFSLESLDSFDRHQEVENVYRQVDGKLMLRRHPFTEDWSQERRREKASEILPGRHIVYGAFEDGHVVGGVMLVPELDHGRMVIDSFHVSRECRRHGIGRRLFETAVQEARNRGATALYMLACSAQETMDFYLAMGCRISEHPIPSYVANEPFDIQLEYDDFRGSVPR